MLMMGAIPLCLYNDKLICSVETQHTLINNTIKLATCFGLLNHLQASSYYKVMVHSESAHIMGSHIVYKPFWH